MPALCNNEKCPMLRDFIIRLRPWTWSLVHGESLIKLLISDTLSFCNDWMKIQITSDMKGGTTTMDLGCISVLPNLLRRAFAFGKWNRSAHLFTVWKFVVSHSQPYLALCQRWKRSAWSHRNSARRFKKKALGCLYFSKPITILGGASSRMQWRC